MSKVLNINVGLLGHIDSGKTSLGKALSTTQSTAAYDKNPQSQERGITIDLGFSSLSIPLPEQLYNEMTQNGKSGQEFGPRAEWSLQVTFVDCPGHASLIRTIIGGAQIIDLMILVVDITKGIQTQTAECLVIGEITCDKMIVALNKVDLIPENKRQISIEKMSKRIEKTLEKTKFSSAPIISVAAHPNRPNDNNEELNSIGMDKLLETICKVVSYPKRNPNAELILSVDHCFSIRGSGTVMTGTIIQGSVAVNDNIEIPSVKVTKKVKSMQMFHKKIESAIQGDRVGLCVTQFDPKLLERGVVCSPGYMGQVWAVVADVNRIAYYKGKYVTKAKFHISVLHETVIAKTTFFRTAKTEVSEKHLDFNLHYNYVEELAEESDPSIQYYVLLEFEKPVIVHTNALFIASKLDSDIHANVCRLAFYGNILTKFSDKSYAENDLSNLKIFKSKIKEGLVDRVSNEYEIIVKNLLKKETNVQNFVGLKVSLSSGDEGVIDGAFGQSGKVKVRIPNGIKDKTLVSKSKGSVGETNKSAIKVLLQFKRFIYDSHKKMIQN